MSDLKGYELLHNYTDDCWTGIKFGTLRECTARLNELLEDTDKNGTWEYYKIKKWEDDIKGFGDGMYE